MAKMTKKIKDLVFRELRIRKTMLAEDNKKGFYWQTHTKHETGITAYLQALLDVGFTEEQVNPILDKANEHVNKIYKGGI